MSKCAVISGASRGIGKSIAYEMAKNGYNLILTCKSNYDKLQNIVSDLISQYKIECKGVMCDMGDAKAVENLMSEVEEIDVLINNAGISYIGLLQDMSVEEWQQVMDTNLNSIFYTSKFAIPKMLKNKNASIINISSMWGDVGASAEVAYSTSKGGMVAFTKALAKELAPSNIRVNCVSCGVIDTDMNKCFSNEEREELKNQIPMGRFGMPEEVAKLVLQIVQAPEYMTGQIIRIDGGMI